MTLSTGLDYVDLHFLGTPEVIATVVLHGRQGAALIDPGPATTLPALRASLAARGFAMRDVRAILLTHIHLDHAGATGTLAAECPDAVVYVHEKGAPHLIDPAKLLSSATRLYGEEMDRLWGEVRAVPATRVRHLDVQGTLDVVGHELAWAYTPGHASHHVSYFHPASRVAFVGDTAGICRPKGKVVLPATPPPDIDLEAWRESTDRILAWHPDQIFLTHFGPQPAPRVHFNDLWTRMEEWSRRVRALRGAAATDEERARRFMDDVLDELTRAMGREEAQAYVKAGRFDFSWSGLARYWRKREEADLTKRSPTNQ